MSTRLPFTIKLNGEAVNTVQAVWTRNKNEIKDEEYNEFYKFLTNSFMEPIYRLHLSADAPIQLHALFFVPSENMERFGFGRVDPGVNLYCRKVLIQQNARDILPEYFRFIKGVVDSEDLPLNISRETVQSNRLIMRLRKFLTKRLVSFLDEEAARDKEKYGLFWDKFAMFIKEGCVSDGDNREQLARLLRFQSSRAGAGELISLADYTGRMKDNQQAVYYLNGPSREVIEAGPYLEAFRERDIEVLYLFDPVDDFVMTALQEFQGKKLVSADQADLDLPPVDGKPGAEGGAPGAQDALAPEEIRSFTAWLKDVLGDTVSDVRESRRLVDSPAVLVNPDQMVTTSMQRILQAANKDFDRIGQKVLEINPKNSIIVRLARLRGAGADEEFLRSCAEQIADNAFLAAGLPGNRLKTIDRIYRIMGRALEKEATPVAGE
ncbi:MAG: molecular chaperone HtpG [Peptococcaceae bacterium]|nr:molecular chaperone HtpG [Peptococcaceae bacterium]